MADKEKNPGLFLRNAGIFNPILVQAVGLCPVVAMAVSLKGAAILAAIATLTITLCEFIASAFLKVIPRWIRTSIYILLGCAIVCPVMYYIEKINPQLFGTLGIYLPVMAVNSLIVLRCERFAVNLKPLGALADGATASIGYAIVLLIVGAMREIFGNGSIMGYKFWDGRTLTGLLLPFGGFLMLGFIAAALRTLIIAFWPDYLDQKQPKPQKDNPLPALAEPVTEQPVIREEVTEEYDSNALIELDMASDYEFTESLETISAEQTQRIIILSPKAPAAEPTPEVQQAEAVTPVSAAHTEPEIKPEPVEPEPETAAAEAEPVTHTVIPQQPVTDTARSAADDIKIEFRELTLEDVINDVDLSAASTDAAEQKVPFTENKSDSVTLSAVKPISFEETDDELEALMNRSFDDIISNKEDKK